jgi:hypothetical protein
VNLGRMSKRLRREMAENPKKAALLGLVTVVALYFWGPLVFGWLNRGENLPIATIPMAPESEIGQPSAPPSNLAIDANPKTPPPSWKQILQWMHDDQRMAAALPWTGARDPFEDPKSDVVNAKIKKRSEPPAPITPTTAGLALTSTAIGPNRSVAQINGRIYTVGQLIEIGKEKGAVRAAFKIKEIHSTHAVLESGGIRYNLTIPGQEKSGKIEFLNRK